MKNIQLFKWTTCGVLLVMVSVGSSNRQPNVVFFMVDDLGWDDVSFHGSDQILTPNIDALAYQGVILQQYYSEPICTPARTALLTGKYPMRLGMQGVPLFNAEDRGIPRTEQLLPSYLKEMGYATHLVGKWHVGMSREEYLPTSRGYDTHYGMRGGFIDYYTYNKIETWPDGRLMYGMDLFENDLPQNYEDRYIVDALTERAVTIIHGHNQSAPLFLHVTHNAPHAGNDGAALQPPPYTSLKNQHIAHSNRRLYADVVNHLDLSFGRLIRALYDTNMLHNTIVVFISDNGAPTEGVFRNWGVNLPFRGQKGTPWEGGVRVPAFIWHSSLIPRVWNGLMHITDWLPTLMAAAGGRLPKLIDGISQWEAINEGSPSQRLEVLIAIDDQSNFAAYRFGDYKLIVGNMSGVKNDYYGKELKLLKGNPPQYLPELLSCDVARIMETVGSGFDVDTVKGLRAEALAQQLDTVKGSRLCIPTLNKGCLFNVKQDPMEQRDLWGVAKEIAVLLETRLRMLWKAQVHRGPLKLDVEADPAKTNYTWLPWLPDTSYSLHNQFNNFLNNERSIEKVSAELLRQSKAFTADRIACGEEINVQNFLCLLRQTF